MAFYAGTVTVASGMPAALLALFKTKIDDHPAWTWVETWNSGSVNWEVFRCEPGVSGLPQAYYVYLGADASYLRHMVSEGWNSTTKKMIRPITAMYDGITGVVPESDSGIVPIDLEFAATESKTPSGWSSAVSPFQGYMSPSSSTLQDYSILVSNTTMVFGLRGQYPVYLGAFTTRLKTPSEDPLPLYLSANIMESSWTGQGYAHYTSRHPKRAGQATRSPGMLYPMRSAGAYPGFADKFTIGGTVTSDLFQDGATWAEPILLINYYGSASPQQNGYLRGEFNHLRWCQVNGAAVYWLDALVIGSSTYVYMGGNIWIDQGA